MFWKVVKDICSVPLGIAAICGSSILAMLAIAVLSFLGWVFWDWVFTTKEPSIFARKWSDDE